MEYRPQVESGAPPLSGHPWFVPSVPCLFHVFAARNSFPCVLLQTSPGHLQAWIRVSALPLQLSLASTIGRELAHAYGGDLASTDGSHLGRLAGFTNQKFSRRQRDGYAPWVRVVYAQLGWAMQGAALVEVAARQATTAPGSLI